MCIPHGTITSKDNGYIEEKPKKHLDRVSKEQFGKGDPDFVDERKKPYTLKEKKSWLAWFLN
ncbi:MAG: hypothetical protein U9Q62_09295 [Campylobacterota bacterium]|nr:hypothetical protein [Campylobacterota bacterium]